GLLRQEYEDIEIIVIDGMSTDETRNIVQRYVKCFPEKVKLIENAKVYTPSGLNIGIRNSSGEYVMIASGHASYSKNYIKECVKAIESGECDIAGGVVEVLPRSESKKALAIAEILKHPFGIGGARYKLGAVEKTYVDTVAYGVYKREVFEKVGLFNENLIRNQDIEFNLRLKGSGYRIMLIPQARAYYFARDKYKELWKNNFSNGFWVTYSKKFAENPYRLRHLIPLFFVVYLITLFAFILFFDDFLKVIFSIPLILYFVLNILSSFGISLKHKDFALFFYTLIGFLTLHISYGIGSLFGIFKFLKDKK
ncbi:MAG TPA: glycosyltransferase family 2 protein, partial [Fervidobacterium nodosum]|nr:glycosyltransferase family 2 protein [Fervidobacterium nodosum]